MIFPFAAGVFLSAYLLFQVQPMIARHILPWFGGSPAVWNTCMLFFQVSLLGGYLYAHCLARWFTLRRQVICHLALLAGSVLLLPITPSDRWKPVGTEQPALLIVPLLATTVGLPYLMISASGPLLQHWFSRRFPGRSPYRLFAISNLGSLLGLLSYPFLVEPTLKLRSQSLSWSGSYIIYTLVCAWCALPLAGKSAEPPVTAASPKTRTKLSGSQLLLWVALAACGSTLLLAMTNQICQDVAVFPFLWVVPLSLYLISFILCFGSARWYWPKIWVPLMAGGIAGVLALLFDPFEHTPPLLVQIAGYLAALFVCCMVCHGELARLKPEADHLTAFYLMIALGGALGGFWVTVLAPLLFNGYWELHVGLAAAWLLFGLCVLRRKPPQAPARFRTSFVWAWGTGWLLLCGLLVYNISNERGHVVATRRGFYGLLHVSEKDGGSPQHRYVLYNGAVDHGFQYQEERFRRTPTSYYDTNSGIGAAMLFHPNRQLPTDDAQRLKVGAIGLGIGIIATHTKTGDSMRFYEINPDVELIARKQFTYLSQSYGDTTVVLGDGRISLERELLQGGSQQFDILVIDAFTGDAIPVHLLTQEAFELYWKHLKPGGILAVHVSNRHFALARVVRALAARLDKEAIHVVDSGDSSYDDESDWVLVTTNQQFLTAKEVQRMTTPWPAADLKQVHWTDDYCNIIAVLKLW